MKEQSVKRDANAPRPNPVHGAMPAWMKSISRVENYLNSNGISAVIDEVAMMFSSRHQYNLWMKEALKEEGVEAFNFAEDCVDTSPITSHYHVEYTFLRTPIPGVRLEAMVLQSGFSPLHEALGHEVSHEPVVVHFSFKCDDQDDYESVCDMMPTRGGALAQECVSTYGKFSYWKFKDQDFSGVYIKPRVNIRDSQPKISSTVPSLGETHEALMQQGSGLKRSHLRGLDPEEI